VSPVQIHVEFIAFFNMYFATLGDGDPEDRAPMAWGKTQEKAIAELLALEGFPQDTPYVVC
jgi:hypothetical protein